MPQITPPTLKPGSRVPRRGQSAALLTGLAALLAMVALGLTAPRFAGHAHASAAKAAPAAVQRSAPMPADPWDSTVPRASGVFAAPQGGSADTAQPITF